MKQSFTLSFFLFTGLFFSNALFSQNYTWMRGVNNNTTMGVYGTKGVASSANDPGSRHGSATWTDAQGNMWLFGGEGILVNDEWFNDLWKYNPTTNQWTWVKGPNTPNGAGTYGTLGVAAAANNPGCREFAMYWTDAAGNFWLFGGEGQATTVTAPVVNKLADLWKYNPSTNQWTWMGGPNTINTTGVYGTQNVASASNWPGGRYWGATWVDNSGKFWLFGGRGYGSTATLGRLNDLWKFDPTNNQWTWVSGGQSTGTPGVYGTLNIPSASNYPGGRECPQSWLSSSGNLILHGGNGVATAVNGYLNDMWEFNISNGVWTWINGSNSTNQPGVYGTQGVPSTSNVPGARFTAACWKDPMGNYWLFGGVGTASVSGLLNRLNDLFKYNPSTGEWTWMKGTNSVDQPGIYGIQGLASPSNTPGSRLYNSWWQNTNSGYLWLMGGLGFNINSNPTQFESMNDLWKFQIPCSPDSAKTLANGAICSGSTVTLVAYNFFPSPVNWYTTMSGGTAVGTGSVFTSPTLTSIGSTSVFTYYAEANSCSVAPRAATSITVLPLPQLTVAGPSSICPNQQTATLTVSGAQSYTWSNNSNSASISFTASATAGFTINATGVNGCKNRSSYSVGVFSLPNITASTAKSTICKFETVVLTGGGGSTYIWDGVTNSPTIVVSPSVSTNYTVVGTDLNGCTNSHTITQFVANCVGVQTYSDPAIAIKIFPSPNNGSFAVSVPSIGEIEIFNQLGDKVFQTKLSEGDNSIESYLPKGLYQYRINSTNQTASGKLIIE
jgi:N-acetylneuraminic acid mutarotase